MHQHILHANAPLANIEMRMQKKHTHNQRASDRIPTIAVVQNHAAGASVSSTAARPLLTPSVLSLPQTRQACRSRRGLISCTINYQQSCRTASLEVTSLLYLECLHNQTELPAYPTRPGQTTASLLPGTIRSTHRSGSYTRAANNKLWSPYTLHLTSLISN